MYLAMIYGLGVCTVLIVLVLLWLGEAIAAKAQRAKRPASRSS
jgi:hypothetical protein